MPKDLGHQKILGMLDPGTTSVSLLQTRMSKRRNNFAFIRSEVTSYLLEMSLKLIRNFFRLFSHNHIFASQISGEKIVKNRILKKAIYRHIKQY